MASDGHIVLRTKVNTEGIKKGQNDITSIFSKTSSAVKAVGLKIQESFDKASSIKLLTQSIEAQKYVIDELSKEYAKMVATQKHTSSEAQELKKQIDDLTKELKEMEVALDTISGKQKKKQIDGVTKGFTNMGKRLGNIVKSALVFSVIYKGLRTMATTVKNVAMGNEEFRKSVAQLQAALWVAFSPIINVIIPALKILVQWLTQAAIAVGKFFAAISGKSYASMIANAKGLKQQSDNYKKLGKSAKDAKKQLAGFDEIQILSSDSSGGAGGAGETAGNIFETFTGEGEINATLTAIMGIVGGAMVALGVLLLFNGQVGWGIGFIIAGATSMGVNIAVIASSNLDIGSKLSAIETIVSGFLLALGLVLFLKCALPTAKAIGLGMIISGVGVLSVGAAQLAANNIGGEIGNVLHGIIAIASGFLLAIGLIMICTGNITPLSIGLVITGAVGLASEIALYPKALIDSLSGWLGVVLAIISGALLVVGIIMVCTGNVTPLSIGLIVAGAVGLAAEMAINWDFIVEQMQGTFGNIMGIVSAGILILGIILCCCGIITPLTIGMIIAGAAGMVTVVAFNWNFIVDKVKEIWEKIKEFWNQHIAKWFTKEHWAGLAKNMMNGLIEKIEQGLNKLLKKFHDSGIGQALDYISGGLGFTIPSSISIPRLAKGAVIPPNREFLAVLGDQKHGTNIEAPAELIKQMAMEAMLEIGMTGQPTKEEHYYLNETELMSIMYKLVKGGERLKGNSLISGGVY